MYHFWWLKNQNVSPDEVSDFAIVQFDTPASELGNETAENATEETEA